MSKITQIQNELKAKKSCYNKFGKYNYRKCEDILEALKPLLAKHEVDLVISDEVRCVGDYTFVEATVSCCYEETEWRAKAQAGIEKAGGMALPQAFGSASSYARKYALGAMFLLDDTEDADSTNQHKAPTAEDALEAITATESMADLQKAWKALSADMKKRKDIIEAKNFQKEALTQ